MTAEKSGDQPITEEQIVDDETTAALEDQATTEAEIAKAHEYPGENQMTREEYDAVGKGEGYEAKDWGPSTRPDDRTFAGTETPVDRSSEARQKRARGSGQDREPQGVPKQVGSGEAKAQAEAKRSEASTSKS